MKMKRYTVNDIIEIELDPSINKEDIIVLFGGSESLSLVEIADLPLSVLDKIDWITQLLPRKVAIEFTCDVVEHVTWIFEKENPGDDLINQTISAYRRYADKVNRNPKTWKQIWGFYRNAVKSRLIKDRIEGAASQLVARSITWNWAMDTCIDASNAVSLATSLEVARSNEAKEAEKAWQLNKLKEYIIR